MIHLYANAFENYSRFKWFQVMHNSCVLRANKHVFYKSVNVHTTSTHTNAQFVYFFSACSLPRNVRDISRVCLCLFCCTLVFYFICSTSSFRTFSKQTFFFRSFIPFVWVFRCDAMCQSEIMSYYFVVRAVCVFFLRLFLALLCVVCKWVFFFLYLAAEIFISNSFSVFGISRQNEVRYSGDTRFIRSLSLIRIRALVITVVSEFCLCSCFIYCALPSFELKLSIGNKSVKKRHTQHPTTATTNKPKEK